MSSFTPYLRLLGEKAFEVRWIPQEIGWTLGSKTAIICATGTNPEDTLLALFEKSDRFSEQ